MSTFSLNLIPLSDSLIIDGLSQIAETLPDLRTPPNFQWSVLEGEQSMTAVTAARNDANLSRILERESSLLRSCALLFNTNTPQNQSGNITLRRNADGWVSLSSEFPSHYDGKPAVKASLAIALQSAFGQYTKSQILDRFQPPLSDFYAARDATLVRLEELNSKIIRENDEHRRTLDAEYQQRLTQLEDALQQRRESLQAEYATKDAALADREHALDERQKKLDDRDHTHARRQLQRDLKNQLKNRSDKFSLTLDTVRKRLPISVAFIFLIAALTIVASWSLWMTTQTPLSGQPFWFPLVRFALALLGLGSSVIFFIRWEDRWSDIHASEEFRLKRLDLDIDRASWLVEVMLEWRKEEEGEIPKELIEHLANGLFEQSVSSPLVRHPVEDALTNLLSSSASLDVNIPGGKATLDRKGIAELGKKTRD